MFGYTTYLSPFTYRYGSHEMRTIWSEENKRRLWRKMWVALAQVQASFGLVTPEQLADLQNNVNKLDITQSLDYEKEIRHDLVAELKTFSSQCKIGGGILHLGATSMDIEDNADALRMRQALQVVLDKVKSVLLILNQKIDLYAAVPVMGWTHIQPAEPTTLGYRLALTAQDILESWLTLQDFSQSIRGKGFRGAVGTGASYTDLVGLENLPLFNQRLSNEINLPFYDIVTQTYPRMQEFRLLSLLAEIAAALNKFAFDIRLLQSPVIGELSEPFGKQQVGSSAMPFKRNPIQSEKIDSLARLLAQFPRLAWDNAAFTLLERTLDDSANRRSLIPEAFLITDELLEVAGKVVAGLVVNFDRINVNLGIYQPFSAIERVLSETVKRGADRQVMHEHLRGLSMQAWETIGVGNCNPLPDLLAKDALVMGYLEPMELTKLLEIRQHTGNAPAAAKEFSQKLKAILAQHES
jgi:adenylosuccinate lyase